MEYFFDYSSLLDTKFEIPLEDMWNVPELHSEISEAVEQDDEDNGEHSANDAQTGDKRNLPEIGSEGTS